jgi:hypothetical protein
MRRHMIIGKKKAMSDCFSRRPSATLSGNEEEPEEEEEEDEGEEKDEEEEEDEGRKGWSD